ncbi:hypothetical protein FQN54_002416 [Arachnomyces sp. PD_36]|nr:hypothetical protein FQN54_002416 [Arachnomyces sp. PD_36]
MESMSPDSENIESGHDRAPTDDAEIKSSADDKFGEKLGLRLLEAVQNQNESAVKNLLNKDANLGVKNRDGKTALRLAIEKHDKPVTLLILENGADTETAANDGAKPLHIAANSGDFELVELLLAFNADIESLDDSNEHTALNYAVESGHTAVAELLLQKGANVDARTLFGHTPLLNAVIHSDLRLVELLLQHGANKKLRLHDGRTAEDLAIGDNTMVDLLRADYLIQGPSISNPKSSQPTQAPRAAFLPPDRTEKLNACHGFEASIVDFFLGDREQRIQVSSSVYEVLYGKGPNAIMASAKGEKLDGQKPRFRWYHLPANNLEWVEVLVNRIFSEQEVGGATLDAELKSKLALTTSAGRQFRAPTTHSSFMRPLCRTVKPASNTFLAPSKLDQTMLFIPYLHFEKYHTYQRMNWTIANFQDEIGGRSHRYNYHPRGPRVPDPLVPDRYPRRAERVDRLDRWAFRAPDHVSDQSDNDSFPENTEEAPRRRDILHNIKTAFQGRRRMVPGSSQPQADPMVSNPGAREDPEQGSDFLRKGNAPNSEPIKSEKPADDPEVAAPGEGEDGNSGIMPAAGRSTPTRKEGDDTLAVETVPGRTNVRTSGAAKSTRNIRSYASGKGLSAEHVPETYEERRATYLGQPTADLFAHRSRAIEQMKADSPIERINVPQGGGAAVSGGETRMELVWGSPPSASHRAQRQQQDWDSLNIDLIRGYSLPAKPGEDPPLQHRRTLDQYFYTHIASTSERDNDQVVYRYTKLDSEPKMFMVDQLWLWILNEDTVISCCPQRWDISSTGQPSQNDYRGTHHGTRFDPEVSVPPPPPPKRRDFYSADELAPERYMSIWNTDPVHVTRKKDSREDLKKDYYLKHPYRSTDYEKKSHSKPIRSKNPGGGFSELVTGYSKAKPRRKEYTNRHRRQEFAPAADDEYSLYEERRGRLGLLHADPLNVHQMILKYLQGSARPPVTSAYDMATIITDTCVNVFDQYQVPDEYQFFDFFERSIGAVIDKEAQCFQRYAASLSGSRYDHRDSTEIFSITRETELLVEIRDIRDELGVLQIVLTDQLKILGEFSRAMAAAQGNGSELDTMSMRDENSLLTHNKVLESHLYRIGKMDKLAEKTYVALNHLLDLKQKQANVSEALSARKQQENTARQARISAAHAEEGVKVAEATARQGKTVLVFTVVTIIFLPLSFLAAFFAINIQQFPWNGDDKLPMDYVLKYMLSISGAVSIPFILVAFNQDRIAAWIKSHGRVSVVWTALTILSTIILAIIWTRDLAPGIKAAVTAVIVLIIIVAAFVQLIYTLFFRSRGLVKGSGSSYTSGSNWSSTI